MAKGISWAVVIGAILGALLGSLMHTVAGGVAIGCGLVAATAWFYAADRLRWRDRAQFAGIFAIGGGAFSTAAALGRPSVWGGVVLGLLTLLLSVVAWFTAEGPGSDLGGPTD
jgi:hypothetical protein